MAAIIAVILIFYSLTVPAGDEFSSLLVSIWLCSHYIVVSAVLLTFDCCLFLLFHYVHK